MGPYYNVAYKVYNCIIRMRRKSVSRLYHFWLLHILGVAGWEYGSRPLGHKEIDGLLKAVPPGKSDHLITG